VGGVMSAKEKHVGYEGRGAYNTDRPEQKKKKTKKKKKTTAQKSISKPFSRSQNQKNP
jgi:phosphoribosylaminoimidazole carboxylase (NCAIR synthetase)